MLPPTWLTWVVIKKEVSLLFKKQRYNQGANDVNLGFTTAINSKIRIKRWIGLPQVSHVGVTERKTVVYEMLGL
jgi:hypothetical protein